MLSGSPADLGDFVGAHAAGRVHLHFVAEPSGRMRALATGEVTEIVPFSVLASRGPDDAVGELAIALDIGRRVT